MKDYEQRIAELLEGLSPDNLDTAVQIASLPENLRGFDMIKERNLVEVREKERELLDVFHRRAS